MKHMRRHWYEISAFIGMTMLALLFILWHEWSVLQRLSIANLAVIFFHFYEEFGFPGGFGKMANTLLFKNSPAPDRWPLNQQSVWFGNWAFAILFYFPPILLPHYIWLGLMPMLFGAIGQLFSHAFLNNVYLKKSGLRYGYNSGLATVLFGHLPLCVAYVYYVETKGLATDLDWIIGGVYAAFAYVVVFRKGIMMGLANVNSPYPFDAIELARFDKLHESKRV